MSSISKNYEKLITEKDIIDTYRYEEIKTEKPQPIKLDDIFNEDLEDFKKVVKS